MRLRRRVLPVERELGKIWREHKRRDRRGFCAGERELAAAADGEQRAEGAEDECAWGGDGGDPDVIEACGVDSVAGEGEAIAGDSGCVPGPRDIYSSIPYESILGGECCTTRRHRVDQGSSALCRRIKLHS